jgi:hypothetical protein
MNLLKKGGKNSYKSSIFIKNYIFIIMGRLKKNKEEKKVKVSISLDRILYDKIKEEKIMVSRIIEKLVREYYGNKDLW